MAKKPRVSKENPSKSGMRNSLNLHNVIPRAARLGADTDLPMA
jgi:hypothetical protein